MKIFSKSISAVVLTASLVVGASSSIGALKIIRPEIGQQNVQREDYLIEQMINYQNQEGRRDLVDVHPEGEFGERNVFVRAYGNPFFAQYREANRENLVAPVEE